MTTYDALAGLGGGVLIGLSATLLMLSIGRIAGVSGIVSGALQRPGSGGEWGWRIAFILGLLIAVPLYKSSGGTLPSITITSNVAVLVIAGLLVGFGTALGSGCTSGHGVCGLARFSPRSLVAVLVFLATAMMVVFVLRHLLGGVP